MNPRLVLLYTRDRNFDQVLAQALLGMGTIVLVARSVGDALQIVCCRGRELDFAVLDFNDGCRGMTLLSALNTCCDKLPTLVVTSEESEHASASAIAYASGARICLTKPLPPAMLASAIVELQSTPGELAVA